MRIIRLNHENYAKYRKDYMACLADGFNAPDISNFQFDIVFQLKLNQGHIMLGYVNDSDVMVSIATVIKESKFIHRGSVVLHVEDVCTKKEYRQLGYSTLLLKEVDVIAKEVGAYKVILDCADSNVEFYQNLDYYVHENCMRKNFRVTHGID